MDECWEQDRSHLTARDTESQRESESQGESERQRDRETESQRESERVRERIAATCFATPSCVSTKITCAT